MCPLEAQAGETGRGELYGAVARRASDGDRWAEIARANEHEKKTHKETERGREGWNGATNMCMFSLRFFFFFHPLQVFNTQSIHTCCSLQRTHMHPPTERVG